MCAARGVTFIVNDDADLALAVDAAGVHLGRDDISVAAARTRLGSAAIIGVSCYDSLERAADAVREGADYIAFGSFFPSTVKPDAVRRDAGTAHCREGSLERAGGRDRRHHRSARGAADRGGRRCAGGDLGGLRCA